MGKAKLILIVLLQKRRLRALDNEVELDAVNGKHWVIFMIKKVFFGFSLAEDEEEEEQEAAEDGDQEETEEQQNDDDEEQEEEEEAAEDWLMENKLKVVSISIRCISCILD